MNVNERRPVIFHLNIGENHHQWVSKTDIQTLVDDQDPLFFELSREFDRETVTPRKWRALARELDQLVDDARAATEGPARYILVGRAPLPVFAYLGARMVRMGELVVANDFEGEWQLYASPNACPEGGRDDFTVAPPSLGRARDGRFSLSIQCSKEYRSHESSIEELIEAEGAKFLGSYTIHNEERSHRSDPLTKAELPVLVGHVEEAIEWIGEQAPDTDSLMVPFAGPAWAAFWVGHRLVPTVCGRFDLPNFVPGLGYRRALSHPMAKAPWLAGRATLLLMHAEPEDQSRTRASKSFDVVQDALERELGRDGPFEIRHRGAARIREFMRDVELTKPDILHLHLHGAENGDLAFEDERGQTQRFKAERFVAMLRATGVEPTLIVLNACHSRALAPALLGIAECVVAMKGEALVDEVIEFSRYFYEAIGRGNDLARAIEQGRAGSSIENLCIHVEGGLDPKDVVLMPRPHKRS